MDARQIQVFRGAMHLLAHRGINEHAVDERDLLAAIGVAHKTLTLVEETVTALGPVEHAKQHDTAA